MTKKQLLILLFIFIPLFSKEKSIKVDYNQTIVDNRGCDDYTQFFYKIEGGLAYFPLVYGGLTNRGITWQTYINYCNSKKKIIQFNDFAKLSENNVNDILYEFYWKPNNLDKLTNTLLKFHIADFYAATGNAALYHMNFTLNRIGIITESEYAFLSENTIRQLKEKNLEDKFLKELIKTRYVYYDNTLYERTLKIRVHALSLYEKGDTLEMCIDSIKKDTTFNYYHYHKNYKNTVKYFYDHFHN